MSTYLFTPDPDQLAFELELVRHVECMSPMALGLLSALLPILRTAEPDKVTQTQLITGMRPSSDPATWDEATKEVDRFLSKMLEAIERWGREPEAEA